MNGNVRINLVNSDAEKSECDLAYKTKKMKAKEVKQEINQKKRRWVKQN